MPTRPDPPTGATPGRGHRGAWLGALLAGAMLAAGCAQEPAPTGAPGEDARRALAQGRDAGSILATVQGNPFGMDEARLDALVTRAMAEGVPSLAVRFTTDPSQAAAPEPHLVVILNPAGEPPAAVACSTPASVATLPARDRLNVLALFCAGDQPLDVVREEDRVDGPTDRRFQRLLWRVSAALFPDDYAETYGFGILPRWLNLGVGGSFGF